MPSNVCRLFEDWPRASSERYSAEPRYEWRLTFTWNDNLKALSRAGGSCGGSTILQCHSPLRAPILARKCLKQRVPHNPVQSVQPPEVAGHRIIFDVASVFLLIASDDVEVTVPLKLRTSHHLFALHETSAS